MMESSITLWLIFHSVRGALREFVNDILGPDDDITRFEYIKRASKGTGPVLIGIALADKHDYAGLIRRMEGLIHLILT